MAYELAASAGMGVGRCRLSAERKVPPLPSLSSLTVGEGGPEPPDLLDKDFRPDSDLLLIPSSLPFLLFPPKALPEGIGDSLLAFRGCFCASCNQRHSSDHQVAAFQL